MKNIFAFLITAGVLTLSSCSNDNDPSTPTPPGSDDKPVFLVIDEESIDNGNPPNNFSDVDVNDQLASVGFRQPLQYFVANVGDTINLYTGDVGDEGWHALKTIPNSWKTAGPTANGARNFLQAGPGLGTGADPEILLDEIPDVTPLRATGLAMLKGKTVLAVVYDGDVSINFGPLEGNLQGANLGIVALKVIEVTRRTDGSSMSLPRVKVRIENAGTVSGRSLYLFTNAPIPSSSSVPGDIIPPATYPDAVLTEAP
ncbi:MAG: hypothetical protein EOP49_31610 [Sphingobacteriales bacterium]|nr:MAG: hypothetical protein EOP49_31610 [Sphingobacteriales bacterium]